MSEPTNEELRQACGGLLELFPKCTCDSCIVARALLSRLDREAEAERELREYKEWRQAARQFAWVHEKTCPRHTANAPCTCGLDSFLSRPRPFVESYKNQLAEAERLLKVAREALEKLWKHTPKIDNGYCAVCRGGYVRWHNGKPGPCSDDRCLSHVVTRALAGIAPAAPEGEKP